MAFMALVILATIVAFAFFLVRGLRRWRRAEKRGLDRLAAERSLKGRSAKAPSLSPPSPARPPKQVLRMRIPSDQPQAKSRDDPAN